MNGPASDRASTSAAGRHDLARGTTAPITTTFRGCSPGKGELWLNGDPTIDQVSVTKAVTHPARQLGES